MKSIMVVLLALFAMVGLTGLGAATYGPYVPPAKPVVHDAPYNSYVPGGVWLQDEAFLAGSGMAYQLFDMEDGKVLVSVNTAGLDSTTMETFAKETIQKTGAAAVYFSDAHTVVKANGDVVTGVTLDLHNGPAIARALKTLF
jgi:hypothetical protein